MAHARPSAPRLLTLLRRDPSADERAEIGVLTDTIEQRMARLGGLVITEPVAQALTRARLESSGTLRSEPRADRGDPKEKDRARRAWLVANELLMSWVSEGIPVSLEGCRRIHGCLLGSAEPSPFREGPAFLEGRPCPASEDLDLLMTPMMSEVDRRTAADGVLFGAGLLYQWLLSVHPFADANGRTGRLAVDWLLGLHGLVPVSFERVFGALVALHPSSSDAETLTIGDAARVIGRGVLHTLGILER